MVLRKSLVCGCNIKLCIDHGYTGESSMKSIAAIVTRTMCDFHLTTFPPPTCILPPISHLCPSGPHFSHLPLPSSFRTRLFLFSSPGSLHRKSYTLGAFRKAQSSIPVSSGFGRRGKKSLKEVSNSKTAKPGQKQKSAVLLPSDHFPPLLSSLRIFFFFKTRAADTSSLLIREWFITCHKHVEFR